MVRKAFCWNLHLGNHFICKPNKIYLNKTNDDWSTFVCPATNHPIPHHPPLSHYSSPTFKTPSKQINPRNCWDKKDGQRSSQEFPSPSADSQHSLRSAESQPKAVPMSEANSPQPPTYYSLKRKGKIFQQLITLQKLLDYARVSQELKSRAKKGLLQLQGDTHFKIIHNYLIIKQVLEVKLRQQVNKAHHIT